MEEPNDIKIFEHDLKQQSILDIVQVRPGMYIGESTLSGLWFYLHGFQMAECLHKVTSPSSLPSDFPDWVAYRLRLSSNWSGCWHRVILSCIPNEKQALNRFFELREEHLCRKPKIVATIPKVRIDHQIGHYSKTGELLWSTELFPAEPSKIAVYTDDPGFFLTPDENAPPCNSFHPALDSGFPLTPHASKFEILDQPTWERLLIENKKYKKRLANTRSRILRRTQVRIT
ncbi:hypothetical protein ACFPT7_18080 [Acidicapsa dinghuensis]|uniref:NIPSNAP domain-containing protein n=1 Tax=Acidicapsa dinghuensis TaxID=2218256 RepID=A0ABW1EJR1_9BACT|nr:hypothetical protein [Acidicapsa dinghuensis]